MGRKNQGHPKSVDQGQEKDKETKARKLKSCEASLTNVRPLGTMHVKPGLPEGSNPSKGWTERYLSRRCMELPPRERGGQKDGGGHKTRTDGQEGTTRQGQTYIMLNAHIQYTSGGDTG